MTQTERDDPLTVASMLTEPLQIEFLYWEECPSHERALRLLKDVLNEENVPAHIQMIRVESDAEAEKLHFPGSPTIRVNGFDVDDNPADPIGLSCRVYHEADGSVSPLPPREKIVRAIRDQTRAPQLTNPAMGAE